MDHGKTSVDNELLTQHANISAMSSRIVATVVDVYRTDETGTIVFTCTGDTFQAEFGVIGTGTHEYCITINIVRLHEHRTAT